MSDLDKYSYHEALDRASLALDFFDDNVSCHPVVEHHKELKEAAEKICYEIANLYQEIARASSKVHP